MTCVPFRYAGFFDSCKTHLKLHDIEFFFDKECGVKYCATTDKKQPIYVLIYSFGNYTNLRPSHINWL